MMKPTKALAVWAAVIIALAGLALSGCAGMESAKPAVKTFACAPAGKLVRAVEPEAQLVKLDCCFKTYKGQKSLFFNVTLKNVSDQPQRFRVNIFMDNGKAVGGLLPRKTKKGLLKPGAVAKFSYPVKGMATKPQGVTLLVKTMSK